MLAALHDKAAKYDATILVVYSPTIGHYVSVEVFGQSDLNFTTRDYTTLPDALSTATHMMDGWV